jgi:uncharacterized membrane protein
MINNLLFALTLVSALGCDATSMDAAYVWAEYVTSWTTWNHLRTAAALAAATSLTVALCLPSTRAAA